MSPSPVTAASVSVVIPHYGDPTDTLALVHALTSQEVAPHEIIVSDDHSPVPFPQVTGARVLRRPRNGGFGATCNFGAAEASGEYVLFLNSDVQIPPRFVDDLVRASAPWQPAITGPASVGAGGEAQWVGRRFPRVRHQGVEWLTPLARFGDRTFFHRGVGRDVRASEGTVMPVDWLVGACLLMPREVFLDLGGFDERFYMNAEEVDLQRRARARGIPSVFVGTVRLTHVGGASSNPAVRRGWLMDARLTYAAKWGGRRRLQAALTAATTANLVVNSVRRGAGRPLRPLSIAREELDLIWKRGPR